jgi:hypothetical protein
MTMSVATQMIRSTAGALASAAVAALLLLSPRAARAFDDGFGGLDDYGWTLQQMQRESIASQEEQVREAGRAVRREELEKSREQQSAESRAYYESLLEASRAALRAPQGAYYRKPGSTSAEAPANAQPVEAGGAGYLYDQGIFWLLPGPPFIVVVPPYGAVVDALPAGAYRVAARPPARHYFFGAFFEEKAGKYEVVKPAAGTMVSYLPDGYQIEQTAGATLFRYGQTLFKPVFVQGVLVYQVVGP